LVAAIKYATQLYIVQEVLVVLFLVSFLTMTLLVLTVALILVREGIRRTAFWAKTSLIRKVNLSLQGQ